MAEITVLKYGKKFEVRIVFLDAYIFLTHKIPLTLTWRGKFQIDIKFTQKFKKIYLLILIRFYLDPLLYLGYFITMNY